MSDIIKFGKYKGQPAEILANDKDYANWLVNQDWFRNGHSNIYTLIVNNFSEIAETPEHNAFQAMFLDDEMCRNLYKYHLTRLTNKRSPDLQESEIQIRGKCFEKKGADVGFQVINDSYIDNFRIELKPSVGDDYPGILRQMKANECNILVYKNYTGSGVTEKQMNQIFTMSGILPIRLDEITSQDHPSSSDDTCCKAIASCSPEPNPEEPPKA